MAFQIRHDSFLSTPFPFQSLEVENSVLRRISGPRREEVTRDWRKLHNEKLNDL